MGLILLFCSFCGFDLILSPFFLVLDDGIRNIPGQGIPRGFLWG